MKRNSLAYLLGWLLLSLFFASPVSANQVTLDPVPLTIEGQEVLYGELEIQLHQTEATIRLLPSDALSDRWSLLTWTAEDKSDQEELEFRSNADGTYEVAVAKPASSSVYLAVKRILADGTEQVFKEQYLVWPTLVSSPSSSSISVSSASNPSSSVVSRPDTLVALESAASARLSIANHDYQKGTFEVLISNISPTSSLRAVKVPVWTDEKGQDDIRWYTATKQSNGSYKLVVDKKNHKNGTGDYHVHLYLEFNGRKTEGVGIAKTSLTPTFTGNISLQPLNPSTGSFDIIISNVGSPVPIRSVRVPVWTEENGQDDIKWYTATKQGDGTYRVKVHKKDHKNGTGIYHAHLYYTFASMKMAGIATGKTSSGPQGTLSITNVNHQQGTFEVLVSNISAPKELRSVRIPVWTDANGQDDIIWYTATRQADGTYKLLVNKNRHGNSDGLYHVHVYYEYTDNTKTGLTSTTVHLSSQPTGILSFENINHVAGTFDIVVSSVAASPGVKAVKIPVWTETNGQDDIKWYTAVKQADGRYKVTVDKKNHKHEIGVYHAHVYYNLSNGKTIGVTSGTVRLTEPTLSGTITIANPDSRYGTFDVIVSNVASPKGIEAVLVPVWSEADGQDDIVWYTATKQANGTYQVTVKASNHKYSTGTYQAHLYVKQGDGKTVGVTSTSTSVSFSEQTPSAKISITNIDNTYGIFDVVVSDVFAPAGVTKVSVPIWSSVNGQNDIVWYQAHPHPDGTYRATIRLANHRYETGVYNAHLYLTSDGRQYGLGQATANVAYTKKSGQSFVDVSSHNGYLSVEDYRKLLSQGVTGVVVKLTEATSYINPFAESQVKNAQAVGMKVSVYHYSHFTSHAEARAEARYFVDYAKRLGLPTNTVMVNDIEEPKTRTNINSNMKAWEAEMRKLGYSNLIHYTGASWIDVNTLGFSGPIITSQFGLSNFWVAQYPYVQGMPIDQARKMAMHSGAAAWQFTSKALLLTGRAYFDLNIDYTGRFTN